MSIPVWETGQTLVGSAISHARNITGNVDNVEINRGVVLVNNYEPGKNYWGMTWGPYINSQNIEVGDDIYLHEYGHTIQSRILGLFYTSKVAIPSGISAFYTYNIKGDYSYGNYHNKSWYEVWASRLSGAPNHYKEYRKNSYWYRLKILILPFYPN